MSNPLFNLFSNILDLITGNPREKKIYEELLNDNEQRPTSTRFGKKAITVAISSLVIAGFAVLFAIFAAGLLNIIGGDLLMGFEFFGIILCIGCTVLFVIYSILVPLTRLRYARWQRTLNDLPIGKRATIVMIIGIVLDIALSILAAYIILSSFA